MKKSVLMLTVGASLLFSPPTIAVANEAHHTVENTVSSLSPIETLEKTRDAIVQSAKDNTLKPIHEMTEKMEQSLEEIKESSGSNPLIAGTVRDLNRVLKAIHIAADSNNRVDLDSNLDKLDGGLTLLKARLEKSTIDSTIQHEKENDDGKR